MAMDGQLYYETEDRTTQSVKPTVSFFPGSLLGVWKLTGCLEVDPKIGELTLVIFTRIFDGVYVEGYSGTMNGENDRLLALWLTCICMQTSLNSPVDHRRRCDTHLQSRNLHRQHHFTLLTLKLFPAFALLPTSPPSPLPPPSSEYFCKPSECKHAYNSL